MRVRGFLAFIEMLDRSSALNRAWENASVDYTKRFKRNRAGKRGRTDTFHFSCPPRHSLVTAIGINRCRSLCVCVCVCAIITGCHHHGLVHITQMPCHCCCCWMVTLFVFGIAAAAGSMQSAATSFSGCYFTTLLIWLMQLVARIITLRPLHGSSAYF